MANPRVETPAEQDELSRFLWQGAAGETIFTQGEFGAELFIIEQGEIELLTSRPDGSSHRRTLLKAGETFGERAMLDEQARDVTARAVTDCVLLRLDYATLLEVIREKPLIGVLLLRRQVRRVRWEEAAPPAEEAPAKEAPVVEAASSSRSPSQAAPPQTSMRPCFVHAESGRVFPLPDLAEATIGRVDRVTGHAPEIDFTDVDHQRSLSRRHGAIARTGDGVQLRAQPGAGNGTFLNGRRLAAGESVVLHDGDRVRFGMVEMTFRHS